MQLHPTYSRGSPDSNGPFDGMVSMLQKGEAQLGITSLTMLPQRLAAVDFIAPTWEFRRVSVSAMHFCLILLHNQSITRLKIQPV
jgi:hypothetical protein